MVYLCQTIYIPDTIDAINVPEVVTVAVNKAAPDVATELAVPQVSAATSEYSGTNTNTSQANDTIGPPTVGVYDTKWY